jgi:hypothetical protein
MVLLTRNTFVICTESRLALQVYSFRLNHFFCGRSQDTTEAQGVVGLNKMVSIELNKLIRLIVISLIGHHLDHVVSQLNA